MLRATLRSLLSRKLRLILSGLAVVLGVMFVSGAFVLTDTLGRSFDQLFTGIYADTDVQVTAVPAIISNTDDQRVTATVPQSTVDTIRGVDGVASANGEVLAGGAQIVGSNGKIVGTFGAPQFGVDWPSLTSQAQLREGRAPSTDGQIAINVALANNAGVHVGQQVKVLTPVLRTPTAYTLVGVFGFAGNRDSYNGASMVAFTTPEAQRVMLDAPGQFSTVDVKAAPGVTNDALRDRVAAELGTSYTAKTGKQLTDESIDSFRSALSFFNNILLGFAAVALFVAVFLILNTFSIIVAQRTSELALLRALGGSRRQVIGSVLVEATVIGLIAAVLGLGLGVGVGALLARVFGSAVGGLTLAGVGVPLAAVLSAFIVGLGVTVVAALLPAFRAARIAPVAAMREAQTPDRPLTRLGIGGGAVLAVGAVLLVLGLTGHGGDGTLWTILVGVLLAFVGVALLTPLVVRPVAGLIGRAFSWSIAGKLGRRNSGRNPRRTAITAAALMIGIALVTGVYTIETSAQKTVTHVAETQAKIDLLVYDPSNQGATFDPSILDQIAALPGVAASAGVYEDGAVVDGEHTFVGAVTDPSVFPSMFSLTAKAGRIDTIGDGQVIVDADTAARRNLHVGDAVTVQLTKGDPLHLTLSGIYSTSMLTSGYVIPLSAAGNFHENAPDMAFIQVRQGVAVNTVKAQIDTILANTPQSTVVDRGEYLDANFAQANQVLAMIQILLALAIIVAVLGVVNTLALSVLERTRELGLLRAVGLGRWQTMRMVTVEAVVISMFGAVLGLGTGIGLGAAVVRALRSQGITEFALPWSQMITYLVCAGLVGVIAAVAPAIRASSINVLRAIAHE